MACELSAELIKLFPVDVINIILSYTCNKLIIQLQDCFPMPLKHITIICLELKLINKHNHKYIRKLNCHSYRKITDNDIQWLENLTELNCSNCIKITDKGIQRLTNLTKLNCSNCRKITDNGIQRLTNLVELNCSNCDNITNPTKLNCLRYKTDNIMLGNKLLN